MLTGVPQFLIVFLIGLALMVLLSRRFNRLERKFIWSGFFAHVVGTIALLAVVEFVYRGGDMWIYQRTGLVISQLVSANPGVYGPALLKLCLGANPHELSFVMGVGSSTGVMSAIAALFALLLGDSFLGTSLALSFFAFAGQVGFYLSFRANLPNRMRKRALIAAMLIPSVVFWTSGLVKETVALGGLGISVYALSMLVRRVRIMFASLLLLVSSFIVGVVKPYVLFPLFVAGSVWFVLNLSVRRGRKFRIRGWHFAVGFLVSLVAISLLGSVYEQYAFENIAEDTARLQGAYQQIEAGSTYELGDPSKRTFLGQMQYAPIGLISTLFRPFIFEVHNPTSLVNALETTALLFLFFAILRRFGIRGLAKRIVSSPFLIFLTVFVLLFAVAVGLAAPNLGTLSRYRVPIFPAYWLLLLAFMPVRASVKAKVSKMKNVRVGADDRVASV